MDAVLTTIWPLSSAQYQQGKEQTIDTCSPKARVTAIVNAQKYMLMQHGDPFMGAHASTQLDSSDIVISQGCTSSTFYNTDNSDELRSEPSLPELFLTPSASHHLKNQESLLKPNIEKQPTVVTTKKQQAMLNERLRRHELADFYNALRKELSLKQASKVQVIRACAYYVSERGLTPSTSTSTEIQKKTVQSKKNNKTEASLMSANEKRIYKEQLRRQRQAEALKYLKQCLTLGSTEKLSTQEILESCLRKIRTLKEKSKRKTCIDTTSNSLKPLPVKTNDIALPEMNKKESNIRCLSEPDTDSIKQADRTFSLESRCPTLRMMLIDPVQRDSAAYISKWHILAFPADEHQDPTDKSSVLIAPYHKAHESREGNDETDLKVQSRSYRYLVLDHPYCIPGRRNNK
ncbi:hypothetical protein [Endozoicomonas elysicola]|uniref:Uncharacterized protein n=1 Tax=Endozoicomonas elysicola TaxID=305900 RepID=A0A081KFN3_9GAMM|nr:hypothetical protein [Endozoicomonas elysicola]KEI72959.1 hypothetical protein GV64_21545 [Endozoicomonas elysicola]